LQDKAAKKDLKKNAKDINRQKSAMASETGLKLTTKKKLKPKLGRRTSIDNTNEKMPSRMRPQAHLLIPNLREAGVGGKLHNFTTARKRPGRGRKGE